MIGQQNSYLRWSWQTLLLTKKTPSFQNFLHPDDHNIQTTDTPTTLERILEYKPLSECKRPRWLRRADLVRLRFREGELAGNESVTWSGAKNSGTSSLVLRGQIAISNHSIWKARKRSNSKRSTSIELRWGAGNLEVSRMSRNKTTKISHNWMIWSTNILSNSPKGPMQYRVAKKNRQLVRHKKGRKWVKRQPNLCQENKVNLQYSTTVLRWKQH